MGQSISRGDPCAGRAGWSKRMIVTEHLTKSYGGLVAVNDLNLQIPQGQFFAFLGPNGAGKTTTIKLLAGLLKPVSGRALVGGVGIRKDPAAAANTLDHGPLPL